MGIEQKQGGRVYTPNYLVKNILDLVGYQCSFEILNKHIIDNSCGDGAFLTEVVRRFISAYKYATQSDESIKDALETYIHGIELDEEEALKCKENLTTMAISFGIHDVNWDVNCEDALKTSKYISKMDYVVGNPPYVRVHNIGSTLDYLKKNYSFVRRGNTDLYLAFYELGLYMLNDTGILGYVTPSSYFSTSAGSIMRDYITQARSIRTIVDLGELQVFNATTYTAVTILTRQANQQVAYYKYDEKTQQPVEMRRLDYDDFLADDGTFLFDKDALVYKVLASEGVQKLCTVKNGIITLLDEFFIADTFTFTEYVIPIIKASTGVKKACIFPYGKDGKAVAYKVLNHVTELQKRYTEYKSQLLCRDLSLKTGWHEFGRSQGVKDVYKKKYAVNLLLRDEADIKFTVCPAGVGVSGGVYILTEVAEETIRSLVVSKEFADYVKALGKCKSGEYYAFSSKDLQLYLNYKLSEHKLLES